MYKEAGRIVYSPSDLTTFMNSPFASWMQRWEIEDPLTVPEKDPESGLTEILSKKGYEHEQSLLAYFKTEKKYAVAEITNECLSVDKESISFLRKSDATKEAIKSGADIIFQAALESGNFRGYADFLVKIDSNSKNPKYEIWDTKLSSIVKPQHIIQLCCYSEMLTSCQGSPSDTFVVVLGNGEKTRLNVEDFFHYYLALKESFLSFQKGFNTDQMPDPSRSKTFGRWESFARKHLDEVNHIALIANITRTQINRLAASGICTVEQLIAATPSQSENIQKDTFLKLQKQALLQRNTNGQIPPLFEINHFEHQHHLGLSLLPPHSDKDVFFDIEGYPLHRGGLEYLWGCTYFNELGERCFREFWAHDDTQEKQAFQSFVTWIFERWTLDPTMHVYHYANYEIAACRKLMGRHGVCEHELDQLLRNDVFVDLYKIVSQGLTVGEPKYSIKNIEHLYRGKRETNVGSGMDSVVAYEKWQTLFRGGLESDAWTESEILSEIRAYNIDDCNSTQELTVWLRDRQAEHNISFSGKDEVIEPEVSEKINSRVLLREALLESANKQIGAERRLTENLAWVLEFHRRELKPMYWRLFDRLGMQHSDLLIDIDCIAMCRRSDREPFQPTSRSRNLAYEYVFDVNQEFKIPRFEMLYLLHPDRIKVKLLNDHSDFENGIIVVQAENYPGDIVTLIPDEYISTDPIQEAIDSVVADYAHLGLQEFAHKHSAILDFMRRSKPNILGCEGHIVQSTTPAEMLRETISAVDRLNKSYLVIQGPPGAGKTYTAKHIIANLLQQGRSIGVSSNSHKAINHLLTGVALFCTEKNIPASIYATKNTGDELEECGIEIIANRDLSSKVKQGVVLGGTAWGFCRADLEKKLDYLFVDEAGQVPMARLIGMSRAADNLILLGDQMQLSQPSQGVHPAESGLSTLDYLLGESPIVDKKMGIFLSTTFRMHSSITQFVSTSFYKGMLSSLPQNDVQHILIEGDGDENPIISAGIQFIPVTHEGNQQASDEEIKRIDQILNALLGKRYRDTNGNTRPITMDDVLFLAPYNHQVNRLKAHFGGSANVGTVDKFQGQEAPVVIYSLCTSDASESPRGLEFLYDRHRINVAISRGKCLVLVFGNPRLACPPVATLEQMRVVNIMSRLMCSTQSR